MFADYSGISLSVMIKKIRYVKHHVSNSRKKYCHKTIGSGNVVNYCIEYLGPSLFDWIPSLLAIAWWTRIGVLTENFP